MRWIRPWGLFRASVCCGHLLSPRRPVPEALDLGAPPVDSPVGKEEFNAHDDLKVTGVVNPSRLIDFPTEGVSGAQRKFRSEVLNVFTSAFASSEVPGAVRLEVNCAESVVQVVLPRSTHVERVIVLRRLWRCPPRKSP